MSKVLLLLLVTACSSKTATPAAGSATPTTPAAKPDCKNITADANALFTAPPKADLKADDDEVRCNYASATQGTILMTTFSNAADRALIGENEAYPNKKKLTIGDASWTWGSAQSVSVTVRSHGHDCMAIYNRTDDHKDEAPALGQDDAAQRLATLCLHGDGG
ncbi:MAG TPA: hypothetical protein VGM39_15675 [Kofleriaceae bacterium]|jgi:hypothetical protein